MPKMHTHGDLSCDCPAEVPPLALVQTRAARRARSCLHVAPTARAQDALAAGRLTIRSERDGQTRTVAVFGELDACTAQRVEAEVIAVGATDAQQIVLDLSGVTFMDTSGVHLVIRADERCLAARKRLRLVPGPAHVQRVLELVVGDPARFAA